MLREWGKKQKILMRYSGKRVRCELYNLNVNGAFC